jgi:hypothetical protein
MSLVSDLSLATFATYRDAIGALPEGPLTRRQLLTKRYRIGREGKLQVFYAPVDVVTKDARIVLVGVTPGWQQMRLAFEAVRDALINQWADDECLAAPKATAAFAGMRTRITAWLDDLGVASWLNIESTSALFAERRDLFHPTSAVRYPVFVGDDLRNYTGSSPSPDRSELLMSIVSARLVPELASFPNALVVPLGNAVSRLLTLLPDVDHSRCLLGFPHPSGANGHAPKQFASERNALRRKVALLRA